MPNRADIAHLVHYVVDRHPLRVGEQVLQPGEWVPNAHTFTRIESWIRAGRLRMVEGPPPKQVTSTLAQVVPDEPVQAAEEPEPVEVEEEAAPEADEAPEAAEEAPKRRRRPQAVDEVVEGSEPE